MVNDDNIALAVPIQTQAFNFYRGFTINAINWRRCGMVGSGVHGNVHGSVLINDRDKGLRAWEFGQGTSIEIISAPMPYLACSPKPADSRGGAEAD